jgi:hypothetical protein
MGSTLAIVIAIAAVVVGFLILKNIRSNDGNAATTTLPASSTPIDPAFTTTIPPLLPVESTTTVFTPTTAGALVLVANFAHQSGVAKTLSTALAGQGFTMATPTTGAAPKQPTTKIQYKDGDPAALAVAQSVAVVMGVTTALEPMPTPVALQDPTTLGDATVLVMLGDDKAGKTLAQMTGAAATPGSSTSSSAAP